MKLWTPSCEAPLYEPKKNPTLKEYAVRKKMIRTGEDVEHDFVLEDEVYVTKEMDLDKYIQSFADDVGIENILKKVQLTGDSNLLNQCNPVCMDVRGMPENNMVADEIMAAGKKAASEAKISFTEEALKKYIADEVAKVKALQEAKPKEGE